MHRSLVRTLVHGSYNLLHRILGPRLAPLTWQFAKFAMVGVAGLVADIAALDVAMRWLRAGPYLGRVFSFLCGATTTWILNRTYTFQGSRPEPLLAQWARFLAANAIGGAVNYATFAVLVSETVTVASQPMIGVAAGSVAGMVFNFMASKKFVFRPAGAGDGAAEKGAPGGGV